MNFIPIVINPSDISTSVLHYEAAVKKSSSAESLKRAFSCIDLTTLNSTDTVSAVAAFTQKVNAFKQDYPDMPDVAAICVYPNMATVVKENLAAEGVKVAAVAGGFPSSMTFLSIKTEEARLAVAHGADEIDIVIPLWAFLEGNYTWCVNEIRAVRNAIGDAHLKVILETGSLSGHEAIWNASLLALEAGADFIKTSTGKMPVSATPEAAIVMCHALRYWYEKTGERRGFKPAGGIATTSQALLYVEIVKDILGPEWFSNKLFRIGASRLSNHLLGDIFGREIAYF
jgi:deoxyribose-phosphate aldolase